jgi:L,D-peptidoglycan transpeptidase YkuD (ErfK/YbiS/YcfS/YnhG family)
MGSRRGLAPVIATLLGATLLGMMVPGEGYGDTPLPPTTRQLVVVVTPAWDATAGQLRRFSRGPDAAWQAVGEPFPVVVGRSGCGWGLGEHPAQPEGPLKREGDGRAAAGIFTIGPAFGRADHIDTRLAYLPLDHGHWCIDLPDSPHYNQIVHVENVGEQAIAGSTEPMRRDIHLDDDQYKIGFAIGHNPANQPAAGSCIFAHLWIDAHSPTAGCVGLAENSLRPLLAWLDDAAAPRLVLLPEPEYRRLQRSWQLPAAPEPGP